MAVAVAVGVVVVVVVVAAAAVVVVAPLLLLTDAHLTSTTCFVRSSQRPIIPNEQRLQESGACK